MRKYRTSEKLLLLNSKMSFIYLSAGILTFVMTPLSYFLLHVPQIFNFNVILIICGIFFLAIFLGTIVLRLEYMFTLKKEYEIRPPFQVVIFFVAFYIIFLLLIPDNFMNSSKYSIVILTLLLVPALGFTLLLKNISHFIFLNLLRFFYRSVARLMLDEREFTEKVNLKILEIKRHKGIFSIIFIYIHVKEEFQRKIIKDVSVFYIIMNLLMKNIRQIDNVTVLTESNTIAVFSSYNFAEKAKIQAEQLISLLNTDETLLKKIGVYNADFKCVISEYTDEVENTQDMIVKALDALKVVLADNVKKIDLIT